MSDELNLAGLEEAATEAAAPVEKKARKEKVITPEEIEALGAAVEKIKEFGVSDNFAKVLPLVVVWHEKEAAAPVKDAVIAAFGGSEKFKDYVDTEFQAELAVINGLNKVCSVLNNVKSFYARREASKKVKMQQISIGGEYYEVNADFLASLANVPVDEKRERLLSHEDTKKATPIEML